MVGCLRNVTPADFLQGNVVFDPPPPHYKLRVSDDQNHAALVDIPLTFGAETPEITPVGWRTCYSRKRSTQPKVRPGGIEAR